MDRRYLVIFVCLLLQSQAGAIRQHRYRMLLDIPEGCVNEVMYVTATNEVNERLVDDADVDIFFNNKKVFNLQTNDTGVASFTPKKAGSYFIQVDADGYLRAETTIDVTVCATTSTVSTIPETTTLAAPAPPPPPVTPAITTIIPTTLATTIKVTTSVVPQTTIAPPSAGAGSSAGIGLLVMAVLAAAAIAFLVIKKKIKI